MSRIAIIGTGYVGLTTGACFAHLGHDVVCADVVPEKVEMLSRGHVPILEAGLDELVREGIDGGRLRFVLGAAAAVTDCEFAYLCVPTPQGEDGSADLSYIEAAAHEIGPVLPSEAVVVNKSTVPVGSTRVVERALGRDDVSVVSNPEFLREGSAVHDFLNPDRIVIGSDDQAAAIRVASLFSTIQAPLIVTDPASAETIKYASNAFLAAKVSFVNAMANVCEAVGADVREVVLGMGYDKRIGFEFLKPGPGWGGSCFHPDETVLARRAGKVRLWRFADLFAAVDEQGADGWEVLSWRPGEPRPEFLPVDLFSARPYDGELMEIRTKMGRRIVVTPDHPFVVGDGVEGDEVTRKLASELTVDDWLPVAQGYPLAEDDTIFLSPVDALEASGFSRESAVVRPTLTTPPAQAIPLKVHEESGGRLNGTLVAPSRQSAWVPGQIRVDRAFLRILGLYLAEGCVAVHRGWGRVIWTFHPTDEMPLVNEVAEYFESLGMTAKVHRTATAMQVVVTSRLLAAWFTDVLGMGANSLSKRIPDFVWERCEADKRALLSGLWDGDGSWSLVNGGPSAVYEYGTASRDLADGILRLLGDVGIMARWKTARMTKSTVDAHFIVIAGAEQLDGSSWLLPRAEAEMVEESISRQSKRIAATGYRRLSKAASWVRVTAMERRPYSGTVYSLEVPLSHTIVGPGGLVVSNCFPKDTRALIRIAEDAGYDFDLLKGVIVVNNEQYDRVTEKVVRLAGGSVEGMRIAVWGLTFKARTDDLRDSPALEVVRRLRERGAVIRAYDPAVKHELEGIEIHRDPYAACEGAAVLTVLTEWDEFRWVDFEKVKSLLTQPRVVDGRNLLDPAALRRRGFTYEGIGR